MKTKIKSFLFFILAVISISNKTYSQDLYNKNSIDSIIEETMSKTGIVGIGAAIIIDKELAWTKGFGYADMETKKPFTPTTIMNIASISKLFTGVSIMKAVEQGKVILDEDINSYLPFKVINPNFPNVKITLRHLATHTSGLADRYPFYTDSTYFYGKDSPETLGDFMKNYFVAGGKHYSRENFLNHKAGTYREYSNVGAGLAGYIVELATGKKLNHYSKKHIFKPLKMSNTGWFFSEINLLNHSKLYDKQNDSIIQIDRYGATTYPDGGVRTSVSELARFFISLLNDGKYKKTEILKKEFIDELIRFQYNALNKPENVKLEELNQGIFWATKMNTTRMGHNGSDYGVRTFMLSDLSKEIGIILFFNTSLPIKKEEPMFAFITNFKNMHKH